jgi:hypothetical protein
MFVARNKMKIPHAYCFLDTNILLHFQTFNEVDWPKVVHAKQVCLVLAPIVLRELDKHKHDYNNERRRSRARVILSKLKPLLETVTVAEQLPQVRNNVSLLALLEEPLLDWTAERLDQTVNDDRLLASILDFRNHHPAEPVFLLADDFPLRLKARSRGIQVLPPDELIRHIEPPSAEEATIRELKQQIQELTNRMPQLRLGFWENGEVVNKVARPLNEAWIWQTREEYVEEEMSQKREALAHMLARADNSVEKDEVQEFDEKYEKYLADLEPALTMQFIQEYNPYCRLELTVINEGTASAQEVEVQITLPTDSSIVTLDNLDTVVKIEVAMPGEPDIPEWAKPPAPTRTMNLVSPSMINFMNSMNSLASFRSRLLSSHFQTVSFRPNPDKHTYYFESFPFHRNVLTERANMIGHHRRLQMKPLIVYLPANTQSGFTITYSLFTEEVPSPITGELQVRWELMPH